MNEQPPTPRPIWCENAIGRLLDKPEGSVTEEELIQLLGRYNLRDGLVSLGRASLFIFNDHSENKLGKIVYRDPATTAIVSQFALSYLATALLNSRASDRKDRILGAKENIVALANLYSNSLIFPETQLASPNTVTHKDLAPLLLRMYGEQFEYQFDYVLFIARNIVIFTEIIKDILPDKFESLDQIFEQETGLNINDYLVLVMAVLSTALSGAIFTTQNLTDGKVASIQHVLNTEKVTSFLKILSTDYRKFREEDKKANINLEAIFTKYRFNPLLIYPIIKTDTTNPDIYVIPNIMAYMKAGFGGLYWWFCRYFEQKNKRMDFTNYFGKVFESYVGRILKNTYGEENVHPEIIYKKGKFIDWWVEKDSKIYLFESKSYQFARPTKQTGDIELIIAEVRKKIVESIRQVYNRLEDVNKFDELSRFRNKTLIPIIVFLEIPMASAHIYRELIEEELTILESQGLKGIRELKIHLLNIEELENFSEAGPSIAIEDIFAEYEDDMRQGFLSVLCKKLGHYPKNAYLNDIYDRFGRNLGVR